MLDIKLLQIMKHREEYSKAINSIPPTSIDSKTDSLLKDFGKYFEKFKDHKVIELDVFIPRFRQWHKALTEEQFNSYKAILRQIKPDVPDSTRLGIMDELYQLKFATDCASITAKYEAGELNEPLLESIQTAADAYKTNRGVAEVTWCNETIADLMAEDMQHGGVTWRLECLRDSMRPMVGGDFGIIAGRPDKGKTTFLASECTWLAPQLPEIKNVLWLNNEGPGKRIRKRLYCAAFGKTWSEITTMLRENLPVEAGFNELMGRPDKIRIMNVHGMHVGQIESILEHNEPGIVIFDMIDNINGFGNESRTDLQLEAMYGWARERCVKYDFIGLATSQISVEGEHEMYPVLSALKDSKTGKQGACDFQLMIGSAKDEQLKYSRFISLPKNKLRLDDAPSDPHCEVKFKPTIARFEDVPNGE